jgi:DNA-binding XRE family transcriptional regulator
MARNFRELEAKMSPRSRSRARARALAEKYRAEMALDELREAREMTQVHLAKILGVNQAAVSKLERRTDIVREHAAGFCESHGWRAEDYCAVSGGDCGDQPVWCG